MRDSLNDSATTFVVGGSRETLRRDKPSLVAEAPGRGESWPTTTRR